FCCGSGCASKGWTCVVLPDKKIKICDEGKDCGADVEIAVSVSLIIPEFDECFVHLELLADELSSREPLPLLRQSPVPPLPLLLLHQLVLLPACPTLPRLPPPTLEPTPSRLWLPRSLLLLLLRQLLCRN